MNSFDNIYKRILFVANVQTQMELAHVLDISQSSISDAKRRQSIPSDWLIKLYDKFRVNPDWLREKKEPIFMRSLPELGKQSKNILQEDTENLGFIAPVFSTKCKLDNDKLVFSTIEETILPKTLQKTSDLVFAYNASGMEPVLPKFCLLGVNTKKDEYSQIPLISGEIYALHTEAEGVIFRRLIQDMESGNYILYFEDSRFQPSKISLESIRQKLIGKLAWVLHKF